MGTSESPSPGPTPREVRQWLKALAGNSQRWINAAVGAGVTAGVATVVQMVLLARIVHLGVIEEASLSDLTYLFTGVVAAIIARAIAQGLQTRFAARSSEQVRKDVRRQLSAHWHHLGPLEIGQSSAGELAREWIDHVEALHGYFARFLPQMMLSVIIPLIILFVVFSLDWLAAIFLLLSAPLIPLFMALVGMGAENLNQQHFETVSRLSGQFLDKVRGITTLQLFGQTEHATSLIQSRSDRYRRITMKTLKVAFLSSAVLEFFSSVAIAVVAMYIGFGLLGYITYGPSVELTLYSGLLILLLAPEFFQPLRTLSQHYHDRAAALGAGSELLTRLQSGPSPSRRAPGLQDMPKDVISLRHVKLSYGQERSVFNDLSLEIRKGACVALSGPSGSGKSSLLHLIAGFARADSGDVAVFGAEPGSFPFGWLGQRGFLVQGSWADNIRLTTPDASDIAIENAIRQVGLGALIDNRPNGIHSQVSEDGQGLSGGQARRLSLARLFVSEYPLILLDEPTAGLDADSELHVLDALHKLTESGRTLVFSTHHQALLALADRILLVTDGEVRDA
ncbi:thiol reductant ABC exporter subunit CydD [Marinobacter salinexigens]|uniref:Thiol reductant ABC exporter subunit CydD n=1 Tax=Marinobacter salinexigens TaxID=2919747 RepID=A0A5B0V8Z7_9GAMM|nr:thiol reductant ABC exporter subunit CydD [Marinobacter salinexigens]KAA1171047.1 thiol reductant ABC exporter subunit CydD [Marinobacter salinexigens]